MTEIRTEMSATVWKVHVETGESVAAGQELLILESMKMEIGVNAPVAGTISALHVKPEDSIREGDLLAELT